MGTCVQQFARFIFQVTSLPVVSSFFPPPSLLFCVNLTWKGFLIFAIICILLQSSRVPIYNLMQLEVSKVVEMHCFEPLGDRKRLF